MEVGVGVCEQMGCCSINRNKGKKKKGSNRGKGKKEIDRENEDMCEWTLLKKMGVFVGSAFLALLLFIQTKREKRKGICYFNLSLFKLVKRDPASGPPYLT